MRVSVTTLDRLTYYRNCEYFDATVEQVVNEIRGVGREETDAMRRGTAFHAILENARSGDLSFIEQDGWVFKLELKDELVIPPIAELKGEHQMVVRGVPVTLSGKVDAIDGRIVYDHKLTQKFDTEVYEDSMQWRCYLLIFGADVFQYNLFVHTENKGFVKVRELHRLRMFRYPGLEDDVFRAVAEFVEFCRAHCPEMLLDDSRDVTQWG